jgi:hypothetical protein
MSRNDTSPAEPDALSEARRWIADCAWADLGPDAIDEITDAEVLAGVERHYDGGWSAFLADIAALLTTTPQEG